MPDPTSQSNYLQIVTQHAVLDWVVDFEQKIISGSVVHKMKVNDDGVEMVM